MKKLLSFTGIIGVLAGLLGMVLVLISGRMDDIAVWHLAVAGVLIVIYAAGRTPALVRTMKTRQARLGAWVSVYSIIVIAVIVVINVIGGLSNTQLADLTEKGLYTLSPQTNKVLKSLDKQLHLYAFFRGGRSAMDMARQADRLLRTYEAFSDNVNVRVKDPELDPAEAEKYGVFQDRTLVVKYGEDYQKVNTITEETITNAVMQLTDERAKTICFTTGHGEPPVTGNQAHRFGGMKKLDDELKSQNYDTLTVDLGSETEVPAECTSLAVVGPTTPIATGEMVIIHNYLRLGGRLLAAQNAGVDTGLNRLLNQWGINLRDDIIMEQLIEGTMTGGKGFQPTRKKVTTSLTVNSYNQAHPVAQDLSTVHPTQFQKARSVEKTEAREGINVALLFSSKEQSWSEKRVDQVLSGGSAILNPGEGDEPGPLPLAAAASYITQTAGEPLKGYSRQARVVAVGNGVWLQNIMLDQTRNYNGELALHIFGWLTGMEEFLAIGAKASTARSLFLRYRQKKLLFNITVILLPELMLILGVLVWWVRR